MTRFTLKALPYPYDSLAPVMSARTMCIHHGKHQAAYVAKLNQLIRDTAYEHEDLELIILHTRNERNAGRIFNNAAQLWNHEFFWQSLSPVSGGEPPKAIADQLAFAFGSVQAFRSEVIEAASDHFGGGWVWLTMSPRGTLHVDTTHDADSPLFWGGYPLFVCDLWEHAYYLDYQQDRARFVQAVIDRLINWNHIAARLNLAQSRNAPPAHSERRARDTNIHRSGT